MTVRVLEHDGMYTSYRKVIKRCDSGKLYESVKRIDIMFPPVDESKWPGWATTLSEDELETSIQIFFDKWNFGNGSDTEGRIFQCLCDERGARKELNVKPPLSHHIPKYPRMTSSRPRNPKTGDVYANTTSGTIRTWNGSSWTIINP